MDLIANANRIGTASAGLEFTSCHDNESDVLASITIRDLDEPLKSRLRIQGTIHGRSMEEEARDILRAALNQQLKRPGNLATAIRARFAPLGGVELPELPREPMREPPGL